MDNAENQDWFQLHNEAVVFDLHAHPALKASLFRRVLTLDNPASRRFDPFSVRTDFSKLRRGRVNGLSSVVLAPEQGLLEDCWLLRWANALYKPPDPVFTGRDAEVAIAMLDRIEDAVDAARDPSTGERLAVVARSYAELHKAVYENPAGPVALIHCVEGANSLDRDLANLDRFFERGVAYLTLAHFYENGVAPPVFPFPEDMQRLGCFGGRRDLTLGLTPFGEQVVERMMELGMLVDVTHCTPVARERVYEMVEKRAPLLATHVGSYSINPSPYNFSDDEARRIADSGGVVGVIFMNYWLGTDAQGEGLDLVVQTLRRFVDAAGVEGVAFGSDFDGFTDPPDDLKDASEMPYLTQRHMEEGFKDADIKNLLGGNALRALSEGWRKEAESSSSQRDGPRNKT